jgi:ATP-dependent DNA helicase RecQ
VERLALDGARVFVSSFDRPNIRYTIVDKVEPREQLLRFMRDDHAGEAGIVYCLSRRKVDETAQWLAAQGVMRCLIMPAWTPMHGGRIRIASSARTAW